MTSLSNGKSLKGLSIPNYFEKYKEYVGIIVCYK